MTRKHDIRDGDGFIAERTQQDGTVRFQARKPVVQADGTVRYRAKTFPTLEQAEDYLREEGRHRRLSDGLATETTVRDLIAASIDRNASRRSGRTTNTYRSRARIMIDPVLGDLVVRDLTPLMIQRWMDGLTRKGYAASTIHPTVAVLYGALREARLFGIITHNPAEAVRRPGIEREEMKTWTETQARAFLAVVRDDAIYGTLYRLAIATGMRPGELRALRWSHVDLDAARLTVAATLSRDAAGKEVLVERTKTRRVRAIALDPATVRALRWHRGRQVTRRLAAPVWHDLGLVFDRGDGKWLHTRDWRDRTLAYCVTADVPPIRHHDFRHTAATLLMERGVHPKVVSDILGHASITMTLDRYSHVSSDLQRAATDALGGRFAWADDGETHARTVRE